MKKLVYTSILSLMVVISATFNVFATPYNSRQVTSVDEKSILLPPEVKQSKVTERAKKRGDFFASADLIVKNNGDGTIGALAVAYARFPIDEAYITIYLDQWDENEERWRQVNYHEEEFYAADYPDGLLLPTVDISFTNQPRGYYYRLRGTFGMMYNGEFEGFNPVTDGVLLN
ncbi:hypothetical protein CBFG_02790 [Clostridiales bacterium 1_7_47FAA]|uniref:DUF6147 family protein n=1 Tax=Enterocloster hominis (ex Hitch et al. 2024) TaxID=1917870 RepID=A0ABV1DE68_9FIRM|nr:hypothetical protein CBFG_02790 [Clostridiales bacterium 1_7_47FAA]